MEPNLKTPGWMTAIIIVAAMPVFQMPLLLARIAGDDSQSRIFTYVYPIYVVAAAWLAWCSYPERPVLSWILVVLMLLTHAAMWLL